MNENDLENIIEILGYDSFIHKDLNEKIGVKTLYGYVYQPYRVY